MYIIKKELETLNEKYQLPEEIRFTGLKIDGKSKVITIYWERVVIAPSGAIIETVETGEFYRYNSETNNAYERLEISPIGTAIKQMLTLDIEAYPNFEQH